MMIVTFSVLVFAAVSLAAYTLWTQVATARDPVAARMRQVREITALPRGRAVA